MPKCTNCGNELTGSESFCISCGNAITSHESGIKGGGKVRRIIKWTGIGCGGFVGLFIILIIIAAIVGGGENDQAISGPERVSAPSSPVPNSTSTPTQTPTIEPTPTPQLSELPFEQLKEMAAGQTSYDDLFRNNEAHVGELVYYRGRVIQILNDGEDRYQLRANVTQGQYSWDDTVFLRYSGPRLLEDDIIEFVGEVIGLRTYKAIFGNEITIPDITIIQSQLIAKASEPTPPPPPASTPTPAPTVPGTPTPTVAPTPTPEPIDLRGTGQQATSTFVLGEGLAIFKMTHNGQSNFAIQLLNNQGDFVDLLVNEIGPFNGSKVLGIEEPGAHILDISADSNWTVTIAQPAPISEMSSPINLSGQSQQASQFFKLASGLTTFKMMHDGNSNFAVLLLDEQGDFVDLLANDIGPFDGSKAVGIREAGVYILDISADGNWTISIEQ